MSCIFVIWKLTQVPLSPCRLACDNFQPPFGQSWFTRSARAASLQWYIFSSQLIILTSLKDESGKILKRLLALSSLEIGIDANRKKKKTVTSPDRSTCEILNAGATTIEDMLIFTHHFCGNFPRNPTPKYQTFPDSKLAILRMKKHHCIIQVQFTLLTGGSNRWS